jgi:GNAT superfamily N-acetyltransferase
MQPTLQPDEPPTQPPEPELWRPAICPLGEDHLHEILDFRYSMMAENGLADRLKDDWRSLNHAHYREQFMLGRCLHHGAFVQGRLVGTAGALIRTGWPYSTLKGPGGGWIMDVYVLPEYRNRGLARLLTRAALAWLREHGVGDIRLVASAQARALRIYEPLGFVPSGEMRLAAS